MEKASDTYTIPLIERKIKEGYTVVIQRKSKEPLLSTCTKCGSGCMHTFYNEKQFSRLKECPYCHHKESEIVIKRSRKFLLFRCSMNTKIANSLIGYIQKKELPFNITSGKSEEDGCREVVISYKKEYESWLNETINNVINSSINY